MKNKTYRAEGILTSLLIQSMHFIGNITHSLTIFGSKRINSRKFIAQYTKQFPIYNV